LKNINSFKNDNRINNFFNNNIYENRNDNNLNNNKKKINFNYNSNSSINKMINKDVDNSDSLKMAENNNNKQKNIDAILANKIIEYFTLLKSNEKNKIKIDKIQKYLINISLNIINKKENHINNLKQNFLKNAKIPENIMRNNYSHQMRINNSVGNDKKENSENIINILNKELNKKNEYIRKIKNVMENRCNKNGIVKAQNFEIIQKRKILLIIKKEINLNYLSDMNNYKTIEELKKQIIELKHNYNSENNNKNYKYKYELVIEEINTKKNEINELNNKIDELTKTNNSLLNKLDTIELSKKNLEQEKTNLLLKIKKLEDFSENKKIIITNSDEEPIEDFSDIIEEQSSENEKEKNLVQENNKLQEKINILQSELNKKILNENDKNRKLSRNAGNNEYENCVDFDPINRIKKEKNNSNNNMSELKMKEDLIEKLQAKINELEKKNNNNIFFSKKDDYIVLSEKNYKTLKWFLLTKKININNLNYENTFWTNKENVDKELIKNLNLEISNSDEEKMIMNYLKKLEEKENIISKLQLKIKNMEKNMGLNMSNKNMRSKSSNTKNILKNNNEEEEYYEDSDFD
jgi:N-terminal acetyltransferase B complex non-catalytic subunit